MKWRREHKHAPTNTETDICTTKREIEHWPVTGARPGKFLIETKLVLGSIRAISLCEVETSYISSHIMILHYAPDALYSMLFVLLPKHIGPNKIIPFIRHTQLCPYQ